MKTGKLPLRRRVLLLLVVAGVLASMGFLLTPYGQPTPAWEIAWANNEGCGALCWEGLVPGQTSSSEITRTLALGGRYRISEASFSTSSTDRSEVFTAFTVKETAWPYRTVGSVEGSLKSDRPIYAVVLRDMRLLKLGDVVRRFGEPQTVYVRVFPAGPHPPKLFLPSWDVSVMFSTVAATVALAPGSSGRPDVLPDARLTEIVLTSPSSGLLGKYRNRVDDFVPWHGYGDVLEYCAQVKDSWCP